MTGAIDIAAYKAALGSFATGVTVVTATGDEDGPVGMTMNSFSSVSLDPPLVLFSIDRQAYSLDAFVRSEAFGVSVLSSDQQELCMKFAEPLGDKWAGTAVHPGHGGVPLLDDAVAHFECVPWATYDGGDHLIFVCRVVNFHRSDGHAALVTCKGCLVSLSDSPDDESARGQTRRPPPIERGSSS